MRDVKMDRRAFVLGGGSALATAAISGCSTPMGAADVFAGTGVALGPVLTDTEIRRNPRVNGRCAACYVDDVIWVLRDLTRTRPNSLCDVPFFKMLRECHDRYGLKVQLNLFYRTDYFYGLDEFSLADVTDAYRKEFEAASDWLKFGFHSLQEYPDYPCVNMDYADMRELFGRFVREVDRFAGPSSFTRAVVPHWVPVSKEGCRALHDAGVKLMSATDGARYAYGGDRSILPYGHGLRAENNRKPETAVYRRKSKDVAIEASLCAYNHTSEEQTCATCGNPGYVFDRVLGLGFKRFRNGPMLNLESVASLRETLRGLPKDELFVFASHEQYFYPEYLAYQPEFAEKFAIASAYARENGYAFIFMEDLVG